MDRPRVTYDATPHLEIGDVAEISVIVDDVNVLIMEFVNKEIEVEIRCPKRFNRQLGDLHFAHSSSIRYLGETSFGVLYSILIQE